VSLHASRVCAKLISTEQSSWEATMTDLESFRALISQRQHEAEEALVRGDVGPRLQMWSHNDPVSLFAAVGRSKSGWNELDPAFHAVASRLVGGHDVSYEIMAFDVTDEMAWTAGFVHFTVSIDGGPLTRYTLRITHVYRREAGEWKVVHEHSNSSQPPDPPRQLPNCQGTVIERTRSRGTTADRAAARTSGRARCRVASRDARRGCVRSQA